MLRHRAFTLVELMVVIAIIGLLSSTVLASLNSARTKARTTALGENARQLANLMYLEYEETGSYGALQTNAEEWVATAALCESTIGKLGYSKYLERELSICYSIVEKGSWMHVDAHYSSIEKSSTFVLKVYRGDGSEEYYCYNENGNHTDEGYDSPIWFPTSCTTDP